MKRLLIISALFIAAAIISGCQKDSIKSTDTAISALQNSEHNIDNLEALTGKLNSMHADNEARLAKMDFKASKNCVQTAIVPDDYATIQEAVDAVCDFGNVIVKSGTYNEDAVIIYKPGLKIKAIGDVTLNGGFGIEDYINDVTIQNFKIDLTNAYYIVGVGGFYNNGCNIKQNTIYGENHIGIYFRYCNNMSIVQNNVSGPMDYGIFIDGYIDGGSCYNNTIAENYVSGMVPTPGVGIFLRADCDNNNVQGNTVISTAWGISFESLNFVSNANCDNNIIKNNIVNNNQFNGIEIYYYIADGFPIGSGPSGNTIGPNNTSNENEFGIYLWEGSNKNYTFNNTALNNSDCDIVNYGIDNTFTNNTAGCTDGVN